MSLLQADGYSVTYHVTAVSGSTMNGAGGTSSVASRAAADDAWLDAAKDNFIVLMGGFNDTFNGFSTVEELEALVAAWQADREAAGWTVIQATQMANWRNNTDDNQRIAYNNWLRLQAGIIFDIADDPNLGTWGNFIEPWTYDRTHQRGVGSQAMAKWAYLGWRSSLGLANKTVVASLMGRGGAYANTGPAGTVVDIYGAGFTGATSVKFGGTEAASFSVVSDSQITATVAAGGSTGLVSVVSPTGTDSSLQTFTVAALPAATITGIAPTTGPVGTLVTITGTSLSRVNIAGGDASFAKSGGGRVAANGATDNETQVRVYVPATAITGAIELHTANNGTATSAAFTVT